MTEAAPGPGGVVQTPTEVDGAAPAVVPAGPVRAGRRCRPWCSRSSCPGCVAAWIAAIVPARNAVLGIPDAGPFIAAALPAVRAVFELSAAITIGSAAGRSLAGAAAAVRDLRRRRDRSIRAVGPAALLWVISGLALIPLTLSDTTGYGLSRTVGATTVINGLQVLSTRSGRR